MAIKSMTGFARIDGQHELCAWSWEIKSVNSKGLDIRCRLASGFERLDAVVRERLAKTLKRGNLTVNLTVEWQKSSGGYQINRDIVELAIAAIPDIEGRLSTPTPSSAAEILALRGVIELVDQEITESDHKHITGLILDDVDNAISSLDEMRKDEGGRLAIVLSDQLDQIALLSSQAKENAASQPKSIRMRLETQIEEILGGTTNLPDERMAQEVALLVTKADIREEIDRLVAHEQAARGYLNAMGGVGRKLDFLCQEFNREANTLCSKSPDVELTKIGLDLKTQIERFREQIQNIE